MEVKLIELNEIVEVCKALINRIQIIGDVKTGDDLYEKYKTLINAFCIKYDIEHIDSEKMHATYRRISNYFWNQNYTVNLKEARAILDLIVNLKSLLYPNLCERVFISHREKDKDQVDALIELLYAIGIARPLKNGEKTIFCSSHPAAYIENGQMIDDQIMKQFHSDQGVFFILWYSDNYFESQPCLNEMGAIWVMNKEYQEILAPGFDRNKIGGLMPKEKISFCATDKYRLNSFKEQIEKLFYLQPISANTWEIARDKFINAIEK